MRSRTRLRPLAPLALLVLLTGGCGGSGSDDAGPTPSAASAPTSAPISSQADPTAALRERCLSALPDEAEVEAVRLVAAGGGEVSAARVGPASAEVVAVLLPQTSGLCGWGRWATAAADVGLTSLLVDPCGYGTTTCTPAEDADPLHEVDAALALARSDLGARRVVLLGTSMGGSLTVMAVAAGADVDAWADVSGPSSWDGVRLADLAPDLPPNGLVAMARGEGPAQFADARALARASGVPFVAARNGHGWDLLVDPVSGDVTRLGRRLMAFASG